MLRVYTRHYPPCRQDSNYRRRRCPKWINGALATGTFIRESAQTRSSETAERKARLMEIDAEICINEAKMKLRKERRHLYESIEEGQQNDEGDYIPRDFADWREIPSEALEQKELRKSLTLALESLPEKYRSVLILRDVQHLSIDETAKILGLSEANVKTRLCRARLQMRDALAPGFHGAWNRGRAYEKVRPF
jgi:RNA polymerase sigma factor (sigma-70 family)